MKNSPELYKKHRPDNFEDVIGQDTAIDLLEQWCEDDTIPHAVLFTGPSGVGKTTLGRILALEMDCNGTDFQELNAADMRGIDKVREIRSRMHSSPMSGDYKIWLLDEVHKWTSDSQHAMLKLLEDTPQHVYFILATTNPEKLLRTVRTRCSEIALKTISSSNLEKLIKKTTNKEKRKIDSEVIDKIIENSDGSARKALVHLHSVINLKSSNSMLAAIQSSTAEQQIIEICRLLFKPKVRWNAMTSILRDCQDEEPEQLRWMILGYAKSVLLKGGKMSGRAYIIIEAFRDHFYDSKHAGLAAACYEVLAEN